MDLNTLSTVPSWFTEEWWNYVYIHYRTTGMVALGLLSAIAAITKWKWDDKLIERIKNIIPFRDEAPKE